MLNEKYYTFWPGLINLNNLIIIIITINVKSEQTKKEPIIVLNKFQQRYK